VVYAVRVRRKENVLKRLAYWLFYRVLALLSRPPIPVDSGDFSIISRRTVEVLNGMPERARFVRGLRSWTGLRQTAFEYERDPRFAGRSKYTLWRLILLALDGVISFSHAPLRLASVLGAGMAGLSVLGIFAFAGLRLFTTVYIPGWTSIVIAILALGSVQLLTVGILGEYVGRIYEEVKQRPLYVVDEAIGFDRER
jgi:dolichol-phosphate mannosyltransferase